MKQIIRHKNSCLNCSTRFQDFGEAGFETVAGKIPKRKQNLQQLKESVSTGGKMNMTQKEMKVSTLEENQSVLPKSKGKDPKAHNVMEKVESRKKKFRSRCFIW